MQLLTYPQYHLLLVLQVFKGHYVATDNAIVLVALMASLGVAAGVLGGTVLYSK